MKAVSSIAVGFVLAAAACGGANKPAASTESAEVFAAAEQRRTQSAKVADELIALAAAHDDAGIAAMMADGVGFGGAWFADAGCRTQFANPGVIAVADVAAFAHCVGTLPLARSVRRYPLTDVVVLTYAPGIELELGFDPSRGRVMYLGYAGRHDLADALPTIASTTLLANRTDTAPLVVDAATRAVIDRELADNHALSPDKMPGGESWPAVWATLKVCVDATGAVTRVTIREATSIAGGRALARWAQGWTFKPIVLGDQPSAACALSSVDLDGVFHENYSLPQPVPAERPETIFVRNTTMRTTSKPSKRPALSTGERDLLVSRGVRQLMGWVGVCIDGTGAVQIAWTQISTDLPDYDAKLRADAQASKFEPYVVAGTPEPVCGSKAYGGTIQR